MMNLTNDQKIRIFDRLYDEYVGKHGLGGMSKADFDALLLWLVVQESGEFDTFELSNEFMIREGRVKSLLETAAVKFDDTDEISAWLQILELLKDVNFDLDSIERGQIRFQLKNPMLYRWLQSAVRRHNSTCTYSKTSEKVVIDLETLCAILDELWARKDGRWASEHNRVQNLIQVCGSHLHNRLASQKDKLSGPKAGHLKTIIETASKLASIGGKLKPLLPLFL